jgi:hypothetical protein
MNQCWSRSTLRLGSSREMRALNQPDDDRELFAGETVLQNRCLALWSPSAYAAGSFGQTRFVDEGDCSALPRSASSRFGGRPKRSGRFKAATPRCSVGLWPNAAPIVESRPCVAPLLQARGLRPRAASHAWAPLQFVQLLFDTRRYLEYNHLKYFDSKSRKSVIHLRNS